MTEVIFILKGEKTIIECEKEENINILCEIFVNKIGKKYEDFKFFCNGKKINDKLTFKEQMNLIGKNDNQLEIIVINKIEKKYNSNINKEEINSITLKYKLEQDVTKVRIFGQKFVENNQSLCTMIFNENEYLIQEYLDIPNNFNKTEKEITINLIDINNLTDISYMFSSTSFFSSPDIHKWDTKNINNISYFFYECSTLKLIPDISKWNISKVTNISNLFYKCSSINYLPDISKWNTINIIDISDIFWGCSSLKCLPDISNWNTSNIKYMRNIFRGCSSLISLPDISKWNIQNVTNICSLFQGCSSLTEIPDISNWNISNVIDLSYLFWDCKCLKNIPDISKWDTINV